MKIIQGLLIYATVCTFFVWALIVMWGDILAVVVGG